MADRPYIVVTGAANGIGKSLSRLAVDQGFGVIAVDVDADGLAELCAHSLRIESLKGDVTDPNLGSQIAKMLDDLEVSCAALINDAACMERGTLSQVSPDSFRRLFDVNCLGPLLLTKALAPRLAESHGAVVNVGSMNAYGGESHLLIYSMTKAALTCMTRNLAPTLAAQGARICQVNAGWTLTEAEIERKVQEGWAKDWYENTDPARVPFGRLFKPDEVAAFILFLLSPSCSMLNGSILDFAQMPQSVPAAPTRA